MPVATLKDGSTIEYLPDMIGEGAMKEVYFTHDRKSVVCFYKDNAAGNDRMRQQRLEAILGRYNPTNTQARSGAARSETEANYYRSLFCWPTDIVVAPRYGFLAPTYPSNFFFQSGPPFLKGKEKNGTRFIGEKNRRMLQREMPAELGNWQNYYRFCIQMARAVMRLHMAGLAHSDLSPNNVLVDPTQGQCIVIDIDSLVVPNLFPPDVIGTQYYIAPEVLGTLHLPLQHPHRRHPNSATDLHALAVLIYQYLLRRHPLEGRKIPVNATTGEEQYRLTYGTQALYCEHPTDASNRPEARQYIPASALGPLLNDLFNRTFIKGLHSANERPTARDWLGGLVKTWDLRMPCTNSRCTHGVFIVNLEKAVACPFCGTRPRGTFPVLKFLSERKDRFMPSGQLVVFHNTYLFRWHVFENEYPGPEADKTPQAYCVFHQGRWLLINQNLTSLTSPGGNPVPVKHAVELTNGVRFRLSKDPGGRTVEVQMVQC
jgi:serine/threonine protein kinase